MPNNQTPPENKSMNIGGRRNARRYALQAMYQWQVTDAAISDIEVEFLRYHIDKKVDTEYFKELIHNIPEHQTEIDALMQPYLDRPMDEVDVVELAVLRIAIYELLKRPDVPYRVIINEALELTKKFGSIDGFKFINGILDRIAKKIRAVEKKMESGND